MVDFHCHLDLLEKPFELASKCIQEKIYTLSVTTVPSAWYGTKKLEQGSKYIKTALGLHPQLAHERYIELGLFENYLSESQYVGEIGLDCSSDFIFSIEKQKEVFNYILDKCQRAGGRIMSIHSRNSATLVIDFIKKYPFSGIPVLHWFSGNMYELNHAIEIGCWFSVNPSMTLSKKGQEIIKKIPKERILTETDSPFSYWNGRPSSPMDVRYAIEGISKLLGVEEREIELQINNNLKALLLN